MFWLNGKKILKALGLGVAVGTTTYFVQKGLLKLRSDLGLLKTAWEATKDDLVNGDTADERTDATTKSYAAPLPYRRRIPMRKAHLPAEPSAAAEMFDDARIQEAFKRLKELAIKQLNEDQLEVMSFAAEVDNLEQGVLALMEELSQAKTKCAVLEAQLSGMSPADIDGGTTIEETKRADEEATTAAKHAAGADEAAAMETKHVAHVYFSGSEG